MPCNHDSATAPGDNEVKEMNRYMGRALASALLAFATIQGAAAGANGLAEGVDAYWSADYEAAAESWRPLAEAGDPVARFNMGIVYDSAKGVFRDREQALEWYRWASEAGDVPAAFNLGLMYEHGEGTEIDMREAVKWYTQAAEGGDPLSQHRLGLILGEGRGGVPTDHESAASWLLAAARQDHVPSMFALVDVYVSGRGVERDLREANRWSDRAGVMMMFTEGTICGRGRSAELISECRRVTPRQ